MAILLKVRKHKATKIVLQIWAVTAIPKWGIIGFVAAKKAGLITTLLALLGL